MVFGTGLHDVLKEQRASGRVEADWLPHGWSTDETRAQGWRIWDSLHRIYSRCFPTQYEPLLEVFFHVAGAFVQPEGVGIGVVQEQVEPSKS